MADDTKKPLKIPPQECYDTLSALIQDEDKSRAVLDATFGDRLPRKFHIHAPEPGKYMVLHEADAQVVQYVPEGAVVKCLGDYTAKLPDFLNHYKLTGRGLREAVDYWINTRPLLTAPIAPTAWKNTPGYTFHRLDFDPIEMPTPLFDDFLDHMETNRAAFLAFCGSLFDSTAQRQFYVWMQGNGNDGKGVWARFLHRIFAQAFVSLSDDERLHDKFFTSQCIGKRVGVFSDCENRDFVRKGLFLSLSGDDVVSCQYKGKDAVSMLLTTMFFFLSNKFPNITGSRAHLRRAIICRMRERPDSELKNTHTYEERFWQERAGIVAKCYAEWQRMKAEHGGIVVEKEVSKDIASENEGQFDFLFEHFFKLEPESHLKKNTVYKILTDERKETNPRTFGMFYEWLARERGIKSVFKRDGDARVREFVGMTVRPEWKHYLDVPAATPDGGGSQF
jgi:hypothetical protein